MKSRARLISVCLAIGLLLSACALPSDGGATPTLSTNPTSAPTALPQLSTAIAATGTALAGPTTAPASPVPATVAPIAASPTARASEAPTGQPTAVATALPGELRVKEAILIVGPGSGASVSSPVRVWGEADPTFEQNLVIQITGADGKIIATKPTTIGSQAGTRGPFDAQVQYSVGVDEPGRISVFATSARDGGLIHLASVEVTLLSGGVAEPIVGQAHPETHIILGPAPLEHISGGTLRVSGYSDYVFESQLSLALCGEGGSGAPDPVCGTADNVLASATVMVSSPDVGQPGPFAAMLAYHVNSTLAARLAVYSRSPRDGGLVHLTSIPVQLAP